MGPGRQGDDLRRLLQVDDCTLFPRGVIVALDHRGNTVDCDSVICARIQLKHESAFHDHGNVLQKADIR